MEPDLNSIIAGLGGGMPSAPGPSPFPTPGGVPGQGPFPALRGRSLVPPGMNGIDPALGITMITNPEAVAGHFAAHGVAPPSDMPENVGPDDAAHSIGKALSTTTGFPGTEGQQGAAESVPMPRPRPTPAAETANDTGAAVPAGDTSQTQGQLTKQPKAGSSSAIDDLGKTLAGLKPIPPPAPPVVRTPEAYRPTNQISRATLPTALLQSLSNITKGTTGPYRLGQALRGIRTE
jgi:hypothetical protein